MPFFRSGSLILGVLLFLFSSCTSTRFQIPEPRTIPPDAFGMAHAGSRFTEKENRLLDTLGVSWIRNTFRWDSIQKRTKQWDFRRWDRYVENAERTGKKILAVLAYDVPWIYGKEEKEARRHIEPDKIPYFLQYVEGIVKRYKGRIQAYEIWNEPNWLFWKGPDKDFFTLATETARRIKEVDPNCYLVVGSFWRVPRSFIRGMVRSGAFQYADAVSFHPYAFTPEGTIALFDELKEILEEEGFRGDVWVTEVGFPTGGWYLTRVSEEKKPSYVVKTLAGLLVRGARVVFWYELFDKFPQGEAPSRLDSELYFGLNYPDFKPKSGATAYSILAKQIAGATYRPDLVTLSSELKDTLEVLLFRRLNGEKILLLWSRTGEEVQVRISPKEGLSQYDLATGQTRKVSNTGRFQVGDEAIFFILAPDNTLPETGFTLEKVEPDPKEEVTISGELSLFWKIR
ncbi:MAG: cellulase family glycosylhydrolase [Spirochaetes bacterium]|nr:cellulase family glycosylhydrolase [Spirochaetota bacterium]